MIYYFDKVYINDKFSCVFSGYKNPIVKDNCDVFKNDYYNGKRSVEEAESEYQYMCINGILKKNKLLSKNISLMINSDLLNQLFASNFASSRFNIPSLNIYSACASFCEGLIIGSKFIDNTRDKAIVSVSSHYLASEKQFRYPLEYGAIRKMSNSATASGAISVLLSSKKSNIRVESASIGKVCVTNHKDANDMGSAMAPSCAKVIYEHLKSSKRKSEYYDLILTGDLGKYGVEVMKEYYYRSYGARLNNVIDAGSIYYTSKSVYAGASGPACLPLVLFDYILKNKEYKKILIVATGSLHNTTSCNLSLSIPSVSHAVSLEVL